MPCEWKAKCYTSPRSQERTMSGRKRTLKLGWRELWPVSVGIVVDLSGSMANKIRATHTAVDEFLKNLEPQDEEFLVTFADRPELRLPFTSDPSEIYAALAGAAPQGSTALFDAVALAIRQMRGAQNQRKVLFLVSDGGDNHSRLTENELRRLVGEEEVQIHAIGIHNMGAGMDREEARGPWVLEELAKMTGGQHYMVSCLLYTSDAADDLLCVDLGGRRI